MKLEYNADSEMVDIDSKKTDVDNSRGRLLRNLNSIKRNWEGLKNTIEPNLASAESRLNSMIIDKKEAKRIYQDIKVIFEWTESLSSKISKASNEMLQNIWRFEQTLGEL